MSHGSPGTDAIYGLMAEFDNPTDLVADHHALADAVEQAELARLRREVIKLKAERDILKKAAAYFARESLPGTR